MSSLVNNSNRNVLKIALLLISAFYLNSNSAHNRTIKIATENNPVLRDTLYDKQNGNIYVLDKNRIFITAYDKEKKLLWKTDPALDSFLPQYQMEQFELKRPIIKYFSLQELKDDKRMEVIWIVFNNTQFGYLLKNNGKFYWLGQD
ncbi:MAG: hypothetical protein V4538_13965 [Bacteroidota bacterium]